MSTDPLYTLIEELLSEYKNIDEDADEEDWKLVDVLLVGSIITDEFVPYESDIDLCVILSVPPDSHWTNGPVYGFDAYLREDCKQRILQTVDKSPISVDVGVYTQDVATEFVEDNAVYSTKMSRKLPLTELTHIQ